MEGDTYYCYQRTDRATGKLRWAVQWTDPRTGRQVRRWCFKKDQNEGPRLAKKRAAEIFSNWQSTAHEARDPEPSPSLTLAEFLRLAIDDPGVPRPGRAGLAPSTIARRREIFATFLRFVETAPIRRGGAQEPFGERGLVEEVTPSLFEAFVRLRRDSGLRKSTIDREVATVRRAFNFGIQRAVELGLPRDFENPVLSKNRRAPLDDRRSDVTKKAFSEAECATILAACTEGYPVAYQRRRHGAVEQVTLRCDVSPFLSAACHVAYYAGLRPGELRGLRWSHIDFKTNLIVVDKRTSKTGTRRVPLDPGLRRFLNEMPRAAQTILAYPDGQPVSDTALRQAFTRLLENLKMIPKRHRRSKETKSRRRPREQRGLYGFRHAFGLRWGDRLSVHKLMVLMGHRNVETTMAYLQSEVVEIVDEFIKKAT